MDKKVLSLFSGCGGIDLGFEGGFNVLEESVNENLYPNWIESKNNGWVKLIKLPFNTVFANDIKLSAKKYGLIILRNMVVMKRLIIQRALLIWLKIIKTI